VGLFPFKGGTRDACEKLELMPGECEELVRLINSNQCAVRNIPEEGIVVDRALFTVDGKHRVRDRLHIKPNDPAMRPSRVCYLGTGTVVIWLYKCNNYNVVYNWPTRPGTACYWQKMPHVPVYQGGTSVYTGVYMLGQGVPGMHIHTPGTTFTLQERKKVCPSQ
jgi:hypothetical protein